MDREGSPMMELRPYIVIFYAVPGNVRSVGVAFEDLAGRDLVDEFTICDLNKNSLNWLRGALV